MATTEAEQVVRAELAAWSSLDADRIASHFASDAVWKDSPGHFVRGRDDIRSAVEGHLRTITKADIEVLHLAVVDNVVLTERMDRFIINGKPLNAPIMGAFEIADGKITAWRDYFDMGHEES